MVKNSLLFKQILPSWVRWIILGFFLFLIIFPLSPLSALAAFGSLYLIPILLIIWIFCGCYWIFFEKERTKFLPIILISISILVGFLSFKLGIFWISWILAFVLSIFSIYLIVKKWGRTKGKVILRTLSVVFGIILILNLLYPFNPFASMWGFFGTGKLIATHNYPCNHCQKEKWECDILICNFKPGVNFCPEGICDDFKNIKNCYCCECIKNFKYCENCFLYWNNSYRCNSSTGKCVVGW